MTYVCAKCAAKHDANDPPCRRCGHDVFASIGGEDPAEEDSRVQVVYRCPDCGTDHPKNNPPCNNCGQMFLETVYPTRSAGDANDRRSAESTTGRDAMFYVGVVAAIVGVIVVPYFLVFIAIPESIAGMMGRSLQNGFPKGARDNPAITGSMMIIRWFGHGIFLLVALGAVIVLLLAL